MTMKDGSSEAVARRIAKRECHDLLEKMEGDEPLVFRLLLRRVLVGAETYGPLNLRADRRCFRAEQRDEMLDALFYGAAEIEGGRG